jgi:K+/H+ antiporter YhaU regulatory subunit KhtT
MPGEYGPTGFGRSEACTGRAVVLPDADSRIEAGDVLVVVARQGVVSRMMEKQ